MQVAIVLYPGFTALDFIGPYEVLRWLLPIVLLSVVQVTVPTCISQLCEDCECLAVAVQSARLN